MKTDFLYLGEAPKSIEQGIRQAIDLIAAHPERLRGYTGQQIADLIQAKINKANSRILSVGYSEFQGGTFDLFIRNNAESTEWHMTGHVGEPRFEGIGDVLECAFILPAQHITTEVHKL